MRVSPAPRQSVSSLASPTELRPVALGRVVRLDGVQQHVRRRQARAATLVPRPRPGRVRRRGVGEPDVSRRQLLLQQAVRLHRHVAHPWRFRRRHRPSDAEQGRRPEGERGRRRQSEGG